MPETDAKATNKRVKPTGKGKGAVTPQNPVKRPHGRPSKYNPEIARIICEQLSEGIPLRQICRENDGFPAWRTVYDWMGRDEELSASIARARDIGYDNIAEQCLQIADTPEWGEETTETVDDKGKTILVKRRVDLLGHRKLQVETRLKLLAKFHPTKYGDRLAVEGVEGGAPITTQDATASKFLEVIRNMEMTKRAG